MPTDDIFIVHPSADQADALKAFVKALKIDFEVATADNVYNPAFVARIKKSRRQIKQGKSARVEKADLQTLLGLE
jgi:hypothetical protein